MDHKGQKIQELPERYRKNVDKWITRAFGRKWLLIIIIVFAIIFTCNPFAVFTENPIFHCYITRLMFPQNISWITTAVFDLFVKSPLYFGIIILIFNCMGVATVIFVMSRWNIKTSMLHPDGSGGLRPIGELALKTAASWAIPMSAMILSLSITFIYNTPGFSFSVPLLIAMSILIAVSTVLVFLVPLRSVHHKCVQNKHDKLLEIQKPFDKGYAKFQEELKRGEPGMNPQLIEELILLNTLNEQIEEMRDWPWDTGILWKACIAILSPLAIQLIVQIGNLFF